MSGRKAPSRGCQIFVIGAFGHRLVIVFPGPVRKAHRSHCPSELFEINLLFQFQQSNIIVRCSIIVTERSSDHLTDFKNSRQFFIALLRMKSRCIAHASSLSMLDIEVDLESVRFCGVPLVGQVMVTKSNIPRKQG